MSHHPSPITRWKGTHSMTSFHMSICHLRRKGLCSHRTHRHLCKHANNTVTSTTKAQSQKQKQKHANIIKVGDKGRLVGGKGFCGNGFCREKEKEKVSHYLWVFSWLDHRLSSSRKKRKTWKTWQFLHRFRFQFRLLAQTTSQTHEKKQSRIYTKRKRGKRPRFFMSRQENRKKTNKRNKRKPSFSKIWK